MRGGGGGGEGGEGNVVFFFFNDTATTEIYTLSLHDALPILLVYEGGPSEVIASASEHGKFAMLNLNWSLTELATWSMLLGTMMLQFAPYTTDQAVVQRYMTTKDEAAAAKGLWLNGLMAVPGLFLFYLVGTCMYVYFGNHPDQLIVGMTNDQVFPRSEERRVGKECRSRWSP